LAFFVLCIAFSAVSISMIRYFGVVDSITSSNHRMPFPLCESTGSFGLDKWIEPSKNLMHSMSDEELFWRASFDPVVKEYPYKRVPKIAFMFLTKGPLPLSPLWERFFRGNEALFSIYIHSSPAFRPKFPSSSVFYKRQIPSKVSEWGQMSICDAERRLLANALLDVGNERFVLLSESCVPLHNFTAVYAYLTGSRYSFVSSFDDPGPYGRGRYDPNMSPEVNATQWRKGSQWFEVDRRAALLIIRDSAYYRKFSEFCRPACYVDEHYFPTMLSIEAGSMIANRSLTWTDWSRGGAHPATFGSSDVSEELVRKIREDNKRCEYNGVEGFACFLFARKFSPNTLEGLMLMANDIL
ncbi:hypothetical protein M569_06120, partial [Genlisea aurea]